MGGGESTYCYNIPLEVNYLPVEKKSKVDAFAYLNIGYRHVANNGFVLRAGVTPLVILTNSRNNGGKMGFVPYINLGKAF